MKQRSNFLDQLQRKRLLTFMSMKPYEAPDSQLFFRWWGLEFVVKAFYTMVIWDGMNVIILVLISTSFKEL